MDLRQVSAILQDFPDLFRRFFSAASPELCRQRVRQWFSQTSMAGLSHFRFGAKALGHFALAERDTVWRQLVWTGKHAQAPVMVSLLNKRWRCDGCLITHYYTLQLSCKHIDTLLVSLVANKLRHLLLAPLVSFRWPQRRFTSASWTWRRRCLTWWRPAPVSGCRTTGGPASQTGSSWI